jgi:hypothetical protein
VATWADVVALGERLPGVEEATWYGTPALKAGGRGFCRLRDDGANLVVRVVDLEDKQALLRGDPSVFHTTPHYDGHAYVLVRLAAAGAAAVLPELIEDAWRISAPARVVAAYDSGGE